MKNHEHKKKQRPESVSLLYVFCKLLEVALESTAGVTNPDVKPTLGAGSFVLVDQAF
jgi:hypothetical protein